MKLTKTQLQDYVLAEASRIYTLSLVEKQKESILKEEAELQESLTMEILSDPIKLKEYRERLSARAKGWSTGIQGGVLSEEKYNPWAICNASTGGKKENPEKFEKCVMAVKEKEGMKENMEMECGANMDEEKGWLDHLKAGRFTEYCKAQGFPGGPSKECAEKAMHSKDASVRGMSSFYLNTVKS